VQWRRQGGVEKRLGSIREGMLGHNTPSCEEGKKIRDEKLFFCSRVGPRKRVGWERTEPRTSFSGGGLLGLLSLGGGKGITKKSAALRVKRQVEQW